MSLRQSVSKWCFPRVSLADLCVFCRAQGISAIDLLDPEDFPTLQRHGIDCGIVNQPLVKAPDGSLLGGIPRGFNRLEHHDLLAPAYERQIELAAASGYKNLICFSGNRDGLDDETGLMNCAAGIKKLVPACEQHGVTLVMELLNSRVEHADYMCDKTSWGVALCEAVSSENFKLLYDIYHMQIMEGDIIATIRKFSSHFAHYHTGGVPGRHEIDETQELNYPAIMRAISETGYTGYVAHEFIPAASDPLASLKQAVALCRV